MAVFPRTIRYTPVATETRPDLSHPSCPDGGVTFVVYQKSVETAFSTRVTATTTASARCARTGADLPAVGWTDEMARDADRLRAAALLAPTVYRVKPEIKRASAVVVVVLALLSAFLWSRAGSLVADLEAGDARIASVAAVPTVGDVLLAFDSNSETTARGKPITRYRWWLVREVAPEAVTLQADPATTGLDLTDGPLDAGRFTGETATVAREGFLRDGRLDLHGTSVAVLSATNADGKAR